MKYISLLFILFPLVVYPQKRDTSFTKIGEYEFMEIREVYKSKRPINPRFKTEQEEIDYHLEKGYSMEHVEKMLSHKDSIIYFHENEKIKKIVVNGTSRGITYTYNYDEDWKLTFIEKYFTGSYDYFFWEDLSFEIDELNPQLFGKFGDEISFDFKIKNCSSEEKKLNLASKYPIIRLNTRQIVLPPNEEQSISLKIKINNTQEKYGLIISNEKKQKFSFPIKVIGYDLDNEDFLGVYFYKNQLPIDIGNQETIIVKLDEGESLLRIYQEDKLIWNHPIGRIVNKLDLAYLEGGLYLLEIVNLKTNSKKYCRIEKEGAN